jgi:PilZ domain
MTYKRVKKDWETERLALRIHSIRQIAVQYEGTEERIISRVPDVSTTGMFINTSRQYAEGAVLNLSFCLALSGLEVNVRGEVRYSLPGVGVGVQFVDIPENAIHSIEREIQLSRRIQRPARKVTLRNLNGRKLSRRKLSRKLTVRKSSKTKATPRKSR